METVTIDLGQFQDIAFLDGLNFHKIELPSFLHQFLILGHNIKNFLIAAFIMIPPIEHILNGIKHILVEDPGDALELMLCESEL